MVFLETGNEEVQKEGLATPGSPENHGMGRVAVVQVQKVRRAVSRFEHGQIFLSEVGVACLPGIQREEKRKVGVVGIKQV
jgi:hypothetical protein